MKKMTLIGLLTAGIIIGSIGNSYFSSKTASPQPSSAKPDSSPSGMNHKKQYNESDNKNQYNNARQTNPFDISSTRSATMRENEETLDYADTRATDDTSATRVDSEIASYTDSGADHIEKPEYIVKPDTTQNTLTVVGNVGALTWESSRNSNYENIKIQLRGPGDITIARDFYNGEVASITESLPDGYYNWQAVTTPTIDPYIKQQMIAVRESGDSVAEERLKQRFRSEGGLLTREQAKNNVQSGGFRVANGEMLDGDIRE